MQKPIAGRVVGVVSGQAGRSIIIAIANKCVPSIYAPEVCYDIFATGPALAYYVDLTDPQGNHPSTK